MPPIPYTAYIPVCGRVCGPPQLLDSRPPLQIPVGNSPEVAVVALLAARDLRSSLGSNLALVREETGLDPWVAGRGELRAALEAADRAPVPQQDSWRAPALKKLLTARLQAHYAADEGEEGRLQGLIDSLVID